MAEISTDPKTSISVMIGLILSAIIPLAIIFIPIYLFFIKPIIDKKKKDENNKSKTSITSDKNNKNSDIKNKNLLLIDHNNTVSIEDMEYLTKMLSPDSTHIDVLFAVLTTPENIEWSIQDLNRAKQVYNERLEKDKKKKGNDNKNNNKNNTNNNFDELLNEDGWADDDDDEINNDANIKAKIAEEEHKKDMERLKQATGQAIQLLEDIDDGVIGQKWVEKSLSNANVWPPKDLRFLLNKKYEYEGKNLSVLEHPGLRRLLCMTVGRLNSLYLNGHPELLEAGSKKLIDQTYFRSSMEYRQRAAMILEAALRIGMMVRSSRLVITIIETVCMFKIGTGLDDKAVLWFNNLMMKQYNILPRLIIKNKIITTPDETNIVTGDIAEVQVEIERPHGENFLRQKLDLFQKQGIPPQVGLSTYREGWWFILCMKRLDNNDNKNETKNNNDDDELLFDKESIAFKQINFNNESLIKFENENPNNRLITAWPMIIQNIAQKSGQIKIQIKIPKFSGKYRYTVYIKSQEYIGADETFDIDIKVIDTITAKRDAKIPTVPSVPPSKTIEDDNINADSKTTEIADIDK